MKRKEKHLSEPDYTDCILPPRALFMSKCPCVCVCVLVSEGVRLSQPNRTDTFPMSGAGRFFQKQALVTPTTIGKALYWSSFKMQHRIKGYMLVHVTHNKVSRIFTSIVVRRDLLSNQICIDKSQRKRKRNNSNNKKKNVSFGGKKLLDEKP